MKNLFLAIAALAAVTFSSCGSSRIASEDNSLENLKKYMQTEKVADAPEAVSGDSFTEVADSDIVIIDDEAPVAEAPKAESKAVAAPAKAEAKKAEETDNVGDRVDQSYRLAKHDTEFEQDVVTNTVGNNPAEQEVGKLRKNGVTLDLSVGFLYTNEIATPTLGLGATVDNRNLRLGIWGEGGIGTEPKWSDRKNKHYAMVDVGGYFAFNIVKKDNIKVYVGPYGDLMLNKNLKEYDISSNSTEETETQIINREVSGSSYYSAVAFTAGAGLTGGFVKKNFFSRFEWGVSGRIGVQKAFRIDGDVYRLAAEVKMTFSLRLTKKVWNDRAVELSEYNKQQLIKLNKERAAKQK